MSQLTTVDLYTQTKLRSSVREQLFDTDGLSTLTTVDFNKMLACLIKFGFGFYRKKIIKMATENNGNLLDVGGSTGTGLLKPTSSSTEDLSEYTDADESISAPTEFLAEVSRQNFFI